MDTLMATLLTPQSSEDYPRSAMPGSQEMLDAFVRLGEGAMDTVMQDMGSEEAFLSMLTGSGYGDVNALAGGSQTSPASGVVGGQRSGAVAHDLPSMLGGNQSFGHNAALQNLLLKGGLQGMKGASIPPQQANFLGTTLPPSLQGHLPVFESRHDTLRQQQFHHQLQQPQQEQLSPAQPISVPPIPGDRIAEKTRYNLACARCRAKKRRCDGARPACSNCVKAQARNTGGDENVMCYYEETVKRKPRKATKNRSDALLDKLNALESMLKPLQNSLPIPSIGDKSSSPVEECSPHLSQDDDDSPAYDDSPNEPMLTAAQALEAQLAFVMNGKTPASTALVRTGSPVLPASDLFSALTNPAKAIAKHNPSSTTPASSDPTTAFFLGDLPESFFTNPSMSFAAGLSEVRIDETILEGFAGGNPASRFAGTVPYASFVPLKASMAVKSYQDLETHLIAIYFTYVNRMLPMMREDVFLADYVPVNRHPPALLNAMMGTATIFSQHKDIYTKFKTPYKAAQHYLELAEKQVGTVTDCVASMQTMMLIGFWDFGCFFGMQAYQWIGQSCRESHKLNLQNSREYCDYKFSVWRGPIDMATPAQYEVRYRTWQTLFLLDTCATMVSGLPLALAEEDYSSFLIQMERRLKTMVRKRGRKMQSSSSSSSPAPAPSPTSSKPNRSSPRIMSASLPGARGDKVLTRDEFASMSASDAIAETLDPASASEWKRVFANVPDDSVFDVPSPVRPHPALFRGKESVFDRWDVEPEDWIKEIPAHMMTTEFDQYYPVQLCFIVRRICRLIQRRKEEADYEDSAPALSVLPTLLDVPQLHDALIHFYYSLPESERAFKSFDEIPAASLSGVGAVPHPLSSDHAPWVHRPSAFNVQMMFFSALAILHDPATSDGQRLFRTSVKACSVGKKLNSLEVVVLAQQAQMHIVRCVYSAYGGAFRPAPSKAATSAANLVTASMAEVSPPTSPTGGGLFGEPSRERMERVSAVFNTSMDKCDPTQLADQAAQGPPSPPSSGSPPTATMKEGAEPRRGVSPPLPTEQPFSAENPPPPLPMVECPMSAFYVYTTAVTVLTTLLPNGVPPPLSQQVRADDGPLACLAGIRTVAIPALVEMMRVWRVAEIYLVRLRQLFDEVTSYLESRMPSFAKRFREIFVETSIPDLKEYMHEFTTLRSYQQGLPRRVQRNKRPNGDRDRDDNRETPISATSDSPNYASPDPSMTPGGTHVRAVDALVGILSGALDER
ncbi:hypothetical protein HDU96_001703 [Phlyctochytrium bullatum]|nr:hypothetical protein HDU96_001703 [Phlyctochytrium bullatum]